MSDDTKTIARLREELDQAHEQIALLREELGIGFEEWSWMGFTRTEATVFSMMMRREIVTYQGFVFGLYNSDNFDEIRDTKIINVHIYNIRKKIKQFDISVFNRWGQGYYISVEDKQKIHNLVAQGKHHVQGRSPQAPHRS